MLVCGAIVGTAMIIIMRRLNVNTTLSTDGKHEEKTDRKTKQQKEIALIRANVGSGAWNLSLIKKQCKVIDIIQQTSVSSEQSHVHSINGNDH